jgi:hypothetical protein
MISLDGEPLIYFIPRVHSRHNYDDRGVLEQTQKRLQEIEDTKGAIIIRISKKIRQHNGQQKEYKRTNNDLQDIHIKLKNNLG